MEHRILSFDPGLTNTGYALVWAGDYGVLADPRYSKMLKGPQAGAPEMTVRDRSDFLGAEALKVIQEVQPTAIGIEDWTYMGNRGKQESHMPVLVEHLRMVAKGFGVPVYVFENAAWKKKTLGIGGANKEQIKHYVGRKVANPDALARLPQHVWDAVGVCFAVLKELGQIK